MTKQDIKKRLEYLRGEIEAERISYGEIAELQSLAGYIDPGDVLLLEWAGVPEFDKSILCGSCEQVSDSPDKNWECPKCHSGNWDWRGGDE